MYYTETQCKKIMLNINIDHRSTSWRLGHGDKEIHKSIYNWEVYKVFCSWEDITDAYNSDVFISTKYEIRPSFHWCT